MHSRATPTEVTKKCIRSSDPKTEYFNWLGEKGFTESKNEVEKILEKFKDWDIEWFEI